MRMTASAVLTLLITSTGPTYAQSIGVGGSDSPLQDMLTRGDKEKAAEREAEYQKALKSIKPTGPAKTDPWGNVRAADPKQGSK